MMKTLRSLIAFVAIAFVGIVGCTKPNPKSCADGTCTDPRFPFCDADGTVAGAPNTCIAVDCMPGEFVACRGTEALTCNPQGSDLEVVKCQLGCDADVSGCVSCMVNADCANPTPICDVAGGACRGCQNDSECDSQVCDSPTGACVPEAQIVFASPSGSTTAAVCTLMSPCELGRAVTIATGSANPVVLRLLPGQYTSALNITTSTSSPQQVVGTGAVVKGNFSVKNGANVDIRDLSISSTSALCGDPNSDSQLRINGSIISTAFSAQARCALTVERTTFDFTGVPTGSLVVNNGSTLTADRIHVVGNKSLPGFVSAFTNNVVRVSNSVFEDAGVSFNNSDSASPGSQYFFAYNTFVMAADTDGQAVDCSGTGVRTTRFENNIIFSTDTGEPVRSPAGCTFANNIVAPFSGSLPGNTIANPQLVNALGGDFHLQASSQAKDDAVPSAVALDTDHDFEGTARPQGPKADIGAFEFK